MAGRPIKHSSTMDEAHISNEEKEARKEVEAKLKAPNDKLKAPKFLDENAKKEWKRIVGDLIDLEIIANIDMATLAMYCDAYSRYQEATAHIIEHGTTVEHVNTSGNVNEVVSPHVTVQLKYADVIRKCASDLGLTISSRLKLVAPKLGEGDDNEYSKFK
ncbi:phage terminase small subunit P27 family [Priestia megaterium]|uniref:phage terminase small subunit P27 family n=1 Tax=Priestia megaterium TaxID=1404 RepID=UPI002D805857|nr:phage terminase small subunit P27 family [Priestia megaterium]MEB4861147.1 phage terminase small subunit P27 family [Priestia megaterium]